MLRSFWKALKPEEQLTEDTRDRRVQVKVIKPVSGVGNYTRRLRGAHLPPAKGYARGGPGLPSQELPPTSRSGGWGGNSYSCIHSANSGPVWRRESEQIKSHPLSLSGLEKCREAPRRAPGYVNVMPQREELRISENYVRASFLFMPSSQPWSVEKVIGTNGWNLSMLLDAAYGLL